jgi:hypothetical protein
MGHPSYKNAIRSRLPPNQSHFYILLNPEAREKLYGMFLVAQRQ